MVEITATTDHKEAGELLELEIEGTENELRLFALTALDAVIQGHASLKAGDTVVRFNQT